MKKNNKIFKLYSDHKQKINYLIGGGWNTLFGYGAFALLYYLLHKTLHYFIIIIISNILSITNAYITYKLFVFKTKGNYLKEYLKFYLVYGFAMVINLMLFPLFFKVLKINSYLSQALCMSIIIIISYCAHKNFTFNTNMGKK